MSLTIKTNISSLITQGSLTNSTNKLNQAIERMSTGYKLNHAKDNAANYSISTNMSTKINAYQVAEDNTSMGLDLVQTASSTLEQMGDLTTHLRALATQANNGTYGTQSIEALTKEANSIVAEINRLQTTAEYNGIKLFTSETDSQSTDAVNSVAAVSNGSVQQSSSSKFISPITRRDTSSMTSLSSVDESTSLTSGTYSISTAEELAKLATMTNNGKIGSGTEFVLANDIDLSAYSSGEGWTPIGDSTNTFQATFDGNGYTISNLYINRPKAYYQGLFGKTDNASLLNIALEDVNVTGTENVGGLVGYANSSTITNCYTTGTVSAKTFWNMCTQGGRSVGGLAGSGSGTITNSYSAGTVTGADDDAGGLIGNVLTNSTVITSCYATGTVTGADAVGGLAGHGNGTITNSYATGTVSGKNYVGGLVGYVNNYTITDCYATGTVSGKNYVGGLVGYVNNHRATITNSYATGDVNGTSEVGGFVGAVTNSNVTIENSYAIGVVTGTSNVGCFVGGVNDSTVLENVYFSETSAQSSGIGSGTPKSGTATEVTAAELDELITQGVLPAYEGYVPPTQLGSGNFILQVGVSADESSQINLTLQGVDISALNNINLKRNDIFETLDGILSKINDQQTNLGATQNRLMSALDEISTQYENLVSSRSTLRDADMADVSSEYIKMQILQQASSTLLATANQTPALALQLL